MEIKNILHKPPPKRLLRHRIHSLQRRADATGSVDITIAGVGTSLMELIWFSAAY